MSKFFTCLLLALACFLQYQIWFAPDGVRRVQEVKNKLSTQEKKLAKLGKKNTHLIHEISSLKNEEEEIERTARSELGMIKEGETFYQVVDRYENFN